MSWVLEVVFLGCPQSGAQGTALLIKGELPCPPHRGKGALSLPLFGGGGISIDLLVCMVVIDMVVLPCVKRDVWVCVQVHQGGGIYDVYY